MHHLAPDAAWRTLGVSWHCQHVIVDARLADGCSRSHAPAVAAKWGVGASVTGGEDILAEVGHLERSIQRHDGATGSLLRNRRGGGIHGTVDAWFEA